MSGSGVDAQGPTRSHRVLLVRQWDEQMGGSGCCGRLGGVTTDLASGDDYAHAREQMEDMGAVYRALREQFPDVDVTVVDGRNWAWLVPAVARDARATGCGWVEVARQVNRATTPASVVVDGVVVSAGQVPSVADAVTAVRAGLRRVPGGTPG